MEERGGDLRDKNEMTKSGLKTGNRRVLRGGDEEGGDEEGGG